MSEESSGEFNIHSAAEEVIAASEPAQVESSASPTEGQSLEENPANTEGEPQELGPEEILNQMAKEQEDPTAHKELLEKINALGAIHNGLPIKVDSPEQLRELIQKGIDYTKKTMAHADEVKAKTDEFSKMETQLKEREGQLVQKEQEIHQAITDNQIMESLLLDWQNSDPELFNYLAKSFQQKFSEQERARPQLQKYEGELKQIKDELQGLKGQKVQEELSQVKQGWEKELSDVQTKNGASLNKLGVKVDWNKVKEAWASDSSNTMSVEQALYAVHGPDIAKAHQSYNKLLQTKNKTNLKLLGRSGVGSGQRGGEETIEAAPGDYDSIIRQASANF